MIHHSWHQRRYGDSQRPLPEQWVVRPSVCVCVSVYFQPESMEDLRQLSAVEQSQDSSLCDVRPRALNYLLF